MTKNNQPIGVDASGFEMLTNAVRDLLRQYPGLGRREILFETLDESGGLIFSADSGALVMSERHSVTDHITQECQYPFLVVYRTPASTEREKLNVQAFLENLGKWLCKEPTKLDGETIRLSQYPDLTDGRKITRVTRTNSYGTAPNENKTQDWILPVTVQYTYEFDLGTDTW